LELDVEPRCSVLKAACSQRVGFLAPLVENLKSQIQGGSNMTGTNCDLFTHNQSRSHLNHLVHREDTRWLKYDRDEL
jgi:hypothetical protein